MIRISSVLIASLLVGHLTESIKQSNMHLTGNVREDSWTNTLQNMSMDALESTKSTYDEFYKRNVEPLLTSMTSTLNTTLSDEKSRVGYQLARAGATAKHPIIMIPGFITAGHVALDRIIVRRRTGEDSIGRCHSQIGPGM